MRSLLLIAVALSASSAPMAKSPGDHPNTVTICADVDSSLLGRLPLTIELGGEPVVFGEWTMPDEQSVDLVGFAASIPSDVSYTVKAGDDSFRGASPRWLNPFGVAGPRVHGIDRITFCRATRG